MGGCIKRVLTKVRRRVRVQEFRKQPVPHLDWRDIESDDPVPRLDWADIDSDSEDSAPDLCWALSRSQSRFRELPVPQLDWRDIESDGCESLVSQITSLDTKPSVWPSYS